MQACWSHRKGAFYQIEGFDQKLLAAYADEVDHFVTPDNSKSGLSHGSSVRGNSRGGSGFKFGRGRYGRSDASS